jgi:hypothetical protein
MRRFWIFVSLGLVSWTVGTTLGTLLYLIALDIQALIDNDSFNDFYGRILLAPLALPFAFGISFLISIIPTYLFGWLTSALFRFAKLSNTIMRCVCGVAVGALIGWTMMHRIELGSLVGVLYGGAIGGAWFACERWLLARTT